MISREQKLYDALRRIAQYDTPERLRKRANKDYGFDPEEAIEMAYENVLAEAKDALRGMRRPT
jgi:uncharacterized protein YbcC (UPF0753/DUF2309 family)